MIKAIGIQRILPVMDETNFRKFAIIRCKMEPMQSGKAANPKATHFIFIGKMQSL
jgi:hypothetical protein